MSQRDRLFLIYIMSLEVESREGMLALVEGVSKADEHISKTNFKSPARPGLIMNFS